MTRCASALLGCGGIGAPPRRRRQGAGRTDGTGRLLSGAISSERAAFAAEHGGEAVCRSRPDDRRAALDLRDRDPAAYTRAVARSSMSRRAGFTCWSKSRSRSTWMPAERMVACGRACRRRRGDRLHVPLRRRGSTLARARYRPGRPLCRRLIIAMRFTPIGGASAPCQAARSSSRRSTRSISSVISSVSRTASMRGHANLFHRDVPDYDVEDVSAMMFGWDDGRIATLSASNIAVPGVWHKEWAIMAERMTGRFTSWNDAVLTRTRGRGEERDRRGPDRSIRRPARRCRGRDRAKRGNRIFRLSEGAKTLRLALAAVRSAQKAGSFGLPIDVELARRCGFACARHHAGRMSSR